MSNIINSEEIIKKMELKHGMVFTALERALLESATLLGARGQHEIDSKMMEGYADKISSFEKELNSFQDKLDNEQFSIWDIFKRRK